MKTSLYRSLGKLDQAVQCHKKSLSILKEVGDKAGEGRSYGNLGNVYYSLGDFQQAIEYHEKHLSIAKEIGDRSAEGSAYCNLGSDYVSLGDVTQAIEYHKKDLNISKEVGDTASEGTSCYLLGRDFEILGSLPEALDYYQSSVKRFDTSRALLQTEDSWKILSFRDLYRHVYTALWRTLFNLGKNDEALCAAEKGRAQALMDVLQKQYALTVVSYESLEPKETISFLSRELSAQTIFWHCN